MAASYDILIIGNGILGLSLGYALLKADPGLDLAIIGPPSRPGSATCAAGAMINAWAELTHGQLREPILAERAALSLAAPALWDGLAAALCEFAPSPLSLRWGTLLIENEKSTHTERANFDAILAALRDKGAPHRLLSDLPLLRPRLKPTRVLELPDGAIDAPAMLAAYEAALKAFGAALIADHAVHLDGPARSVTTAEGSAYSAKHVVLANGSFARDLIAGDEILRATIPPLLYGIGCALDIACLEPRLAGLDQVVRTADRGAAPSAYLVPQGDGTFYFGATARHSITPDFGVEERSIQAMITALAEELDPVFGNAQISVRGPGFRPIAADGFPLLGETERPGIWLLNGMRRDGFTASPHLARLFAQAMLAPGSHALPNRFAPCRPLISYKTREAAIAEAVTLSRDGPHTARARIEAIYARCGIGAFGIWPELLPLYEDPGSFAAIDHPRQAH